MCPNCQSLGVENKLRYFYVNLDEALWKCSGATCFYPFDKFRFKNFADNTVYYYEKIADEPANLETKIIKCEQKVGRTLRPVKTEKKPKHLKLSPIKLSPVKHTEAHITNTSSIDEFDFDAFTAEFFKTDSPEESQSSFKSDFDLMDGFGCETDYKTSTNQPAEEQFDVNSLNDMLDDLINDKSSQIVDVKYAKDNKRTLKVFEKSMAIHEPLMRPPPPPPPPRTIDLDKEERIGEQKYVEMPRPKLTKCFKHIEQKIKVKEERIADDEQHPSGNLAPKAEVMAIKIERPARMRKRSQTKDGKKMIMPMLRKSPTKVASLNSTLISLLTSKNNFRPLSFLERLSSMDIAKTSVRTLKRIAAAGVPSIETNIQREIRLNRNRSQQNKGKIGKVKRIK